MTGMHSAQPHSPWRDCEWPDHGEIANVTSRAQQWEREIKEVPHGHLKLLLFDDFIRRSHADIEASIPPTH